MLVVSDSIEHVLRLRRCEARVATIGFTLFYALRCIIQIFRWVVFRKNTRKEPMVITKDCAVMKASFEDEIYSTPKESKTICSVKGDIAVCSWRKYSIQASVSYKELLSLIPSIILLSDAGRVVVDNIYYYNSKVDIIKNDEGHNLLILRDAKVVIDLFNFTREMFVGENKTDGSSSRI